MTPAPTLQTEGQVFDVLHERFGVGDWQEGNDVPWHEFKRKECIKIKAMRLKRNTSCAELITTVRYCGAHNLDIREHWQLYEHITAAMRWDRDRQEMRRTRGTQLAIDQALELEMERDPNGPWVERLVRAVGPQRQEVYQQWLEEHRAGT